MFKKIASKIFDVFLYVFVVVLLIIALIYLVAFAGMIELKFGG